MEQSEPNKLRNLAEIKALLEQSKKLHEDYINGKILKFDKFEMNVERICVLEWVLGIHDNLMQFSVLYHGILSDW